MAQIFSTQPKLEAQPLPIGLPENAKKPKMNTFTPLTHLARFLLMKRGALGRLARCQWLQSCSLRM